MVITINSRKMLSGYNTKFTILTIMLNSLITKAENLKGSLLNGLHKNCFCVCLVLFLQVLYADQFFKSRIHWVI